MSQPLPDPPVPADLDLRNFDYMPLNLARLFNSDTWLDAADRPFLAFALINLWGRAWHQVPAGSLPDDDRKLELIANVPGHWNELRAIAMRGFVLCSDGRYHHPIISGLAMEATRHQKKRKRAAKIAANSRWKHKKTLHAKRNATDDANAMRFDAKEGKGREDISPLAPSEPSPLTGEPTDLLDIPLSCDRTMEGEAVKLWNATAERCGLPVVQKVTNARRAKLKARLKDCGGLSGWKAALAKIEAIPGLHGGAGGEGHENWKADFDFLLAESRFTKLMEGSYDNWGRGGAGGAGGAIRAAFDRLDAELGGQR